MAASDFFSNDEVRTDLRGKTVRGGMWTGIAQGVGAVISLGAVPALSRLLDPADFGLVAMVAVFTNFARMFVDAGLSVATIQREEINHQQVSNLFWLAAGLGALIAAIVASLSPAIAWIYGEPRLIPITLAMTASYFIAGLTIQHQALLRRQMHFRSLAAIQITSVVLAQAFGIAWAWQYYGQEQDYWALVWIPLVTALVTMLGCWAACPWRPTVPRRGAGVRSMIGFGANLTGFNFVNYFARQLDKGLIGWKFGEVELGYYDRAYRLFLAPITQMIGPISAVSLPALSRLKDEPERFRAAYLKILQPLLCVLCPFVVFLIIQSEPVVLLVLGEDFLPSAQIFRCLLIVGIVQPFTNAVSWIMFAHGRGKDILVLGVIGACIKILSFIVGLPWGPVGVALAYSLSGVLIHTPMAIIFVTRKGPVSAWMLIRTLLTALVPAIAVAAATLPTAYASQGLASELSLLISVTVACLVWAATVFTMPSVRHVFLDLREVAGI